MTIPYFHVDAFAGRLFGGNPAGVCVLDEWLADPLLQAIAAENHLPETAFVRAREDGAFGLRWFTPKIEVDLCGHATLAAAHVLLRRYRHSKSTVEFDTRSGRLSVAKEGDRLVLDFPSRPAAACDAPADLIVGLGRAPVAVAKSRDYLAVFESADEVRALNPDMAALARLDALGVIATAPGGDCDFVSRFFAPGAGIPEDPVTGSAHCTLAPYWSERLGKTNLHAWQISARGGELFCEMRGDRVAIGGLATMYLEGMISLPGTPP